MTICLVYTSTSTFRASLLLLLLLLLHHNFKGFCNPHTFTKLYTDVRRSRPYNFSALYYSLFYLWFYVESDDGYTRSVQKVSDLNFSRLNKSSTGSVHLCRCGGAFMRMRDFFPACRKNQSPAVGRWLCKCCERSSDCQLLQNDGTTWAALLHKILPKAWQYPSGNYSKDSTGFRGCHEYHRNKRVVQPHQRWLHVSWQRTTSW